MAERGIADGKCKIIRKSKISEGHLLNEVNSNRQLEDVYVMYPGNDAIDLKDLKDKKE